MFDNSSPPYDRHARVEEWMFLVLVALATLLLMAELLSLYSTPIPDSYLWWGDESWLMIEFRTQILTGIFRHPYALGSSLVTGSGVIFGNMWVPALLYGVPAALVSPTTMDIVLLGRTVTAVLAFTLVFAIFEIVRRITSDRLLSILGVLLLITSRSFLFTSHSARYDILSALAIVIGIYILFCFSARGARPLGIIIAGFVTAATLLITIHVTLALSIATLASILFAARGPRIRALVLFIAGAVCFVALLGGITAFRGLPTVSSNFSGAFALNLHDIPALRLYSRSVQIANIVQRWQAFGELGLGYLIAFGTILVLFFVQLIRKKMSWRLGVRTAILAIVLFSWLEFESAAPTSYLIYILPILSVVAALALERLLAAPARKWVIAGIAILLAFLSLRGMPGPHGEGYQIMSDNYQAVGTALNQIEESDSSSHPLVLAFNPAVHEVLRDTNVRLMTTQFVEFPEQAGTVDSVLRRERVDYALVYLSAIKPDYMREVVPILRALDSNATPLWERTGYFTDIGRSYCNSIPGLPDTIRLYKLHD